MLAPACPSYHRRQPEATVLYEVVRENLETLLEQARKLGEHGLPRFVERKFRRYLECGILAHGFLRFHCDGCGEDLLVAF